MLPTQGEFGGVELFADGAAQELLHRNATRERAEYGAVLRRDIVDIVRHFKRSGARHVLRHQRRIAGYVLAHVACQRARIDVVAAASRKSDQNLNRLALIEIGDCIGRLCRHGGKTDERRQTQRGPGPQHKLHGHCAPLSEA